MFRLRPFFYCVAATTAATDAAKNPATSNVPQQQQKQPLVPPTPVISTCDMELIQFNNDTFVVRGCRNFTSATAPFCNEMREMEGKFSAYLKHPAEEFKFGGWLFQNGKKETVESWMRNLYQNEAEHAIPEDFQRVVSPNGAIELIRLSDRWLCIRGTIGQEHATRFYSKDLKNRLRGAFNTSLKKRPAKKDESNKNDADADDCKDPRDNGVRTFIGWMIPREKKHLAIEWVQSLTDDVPSTTSGNFRTFKKYDDERHHHHHQVGDAQEQQQQQQVENTHQAEGKSEEKKSSSQDEDTSNNKEDWGTQ